MAEFNINSLRADLESAYDTVLSDSNDLKACEVALQDVIEKNFPDKLWWQVCDVDIFSELLGHRGKEYIVTKIIGNIERRLYS